MKKIDIKRLFKAIEDDDRATLTELLDSNPDALEILGEHNRFVRDKTPLMYAIQCFNIELADFLLDRGADACAVMPAGPCDTVLQMCVERAYCNAETHDEWIDLTVRLLDAGADASGALWRALHSFGGIVDRPDVIRLLLERGADPDQMVGNSGNTARELVQVNAHNYTPTVLDLFDVSS